MEELVGLLRQGRELNIEPDTFLGLRNAEMENFVLMVHGTSCHQLSVELVVLLRPCEYMIHYDSHHCHHVVMKEYSGALTPRDPDQFDLC